MVARILASVRYVSAATEGQGLIEYGLVTVLISISAIVVMIALSGQIGALFSAATAALP